MSKSLRSETRELSHHVGSLCEAFMRSPQRLSLSMLSASIHVPGPQLLLIHLEPGCCMELPCIDSNFSANKASKGASVAGRPRHQAPTKKASLLEDFVRRSGRRYSAVCFSRKLGTHQSFCYDSSFSRHDILGLSCPALIVSTMDGLRRACGRRGRQS